jgi:hypothetical protein
MPKYALDLFVEPRGNKFFYSIVIIFAHFGFEYLLLGVRIKELLHDTAPR